MSLMKGYWWGFEWHSLAIITPWSYHYFWQFSAYSSLRLLSLRPSAPTRCTSGVAWGGSATSPSASTTIPRSPTSKPGRQWSSHVLYILCLRHCFYPKVQQREIQKKILQESSMCKHGSHRWALLFYFMTASEISSSSPDCSAKT